MVVALYCPLVPGSVEYPMPYASCLGCCGVWLSCASLSCSLDCSAPQLVLLCSPQRSSACPGIWASAASFYLVHSCDALCDSLSRLMPSGLACLASQALIGQLHSGMACLACDWLVYDFAHPSVSVVSLAMIGFCCDHLCGQLNYQAFTHWLICGATNY